MKKERNKQFCRIFDCLIATLQHMADAYCYYYADCAWGKLYKLHLDTIAYLFPGDDITVNR